ncbi:hypothetical protein [Fusibacter sp. JL216-2]
MNDKFRYIVIKAKKGIPLLHKKSGLSDLQGNRFASVIGLKKQGGLDEDV